MVHRKPAKGACIAVRENEFQTFESHKDKEISLLFKQFAKKTTKKPRLFHLKTAMSDGFAEKKHAYSLQDSIVFVDQWVNCLFVCLPQALYGGGMTL